MIARRTLGALAVATAVLTLLGCSQKPAATAPPKEIVFSILSAESQATTSPLWQPLIDDMSAQIGVKVKAFYASNYTSLIEAMRFKQVQVGWFSADPALEAVNRADAEILGRIVNRGGRTTYESVIIAKKGRGITAEDVLKCGKRLTFGIGDAKSTSGTLAPMAYFFTPHHVTPTECFSAVRSSNHQGNAFAVANGVLDVATNNSVGMEFFARQQPDLAAKLEVIWRSPPLPESSIVVRKDLDPALKEKIRQFFLTYGTGAGPQADRQREILKKLEYEGFKPADASYFDQIHEMNGILALADAEKSGDKAKVAAAQANLDKIRARISEARAKNPDI